MTERETDTELREKLMTLALKWCESRNQAMQACGDVLEFTLLSTPPAPLPTTEREQVRQAMVTGDSFLSLLWHRHTRRESRDDFNLQIDVQRAIDDLRTWSERLAAPPAPLPAQPTEKPFEQQASCRCPAKEGEVCPLTADERAARVSSALSAQEPETLEDRWRREMYPHHDKATFDRFLADTTAEGWDEVRREVAALKRIVAAPSPQETALRTGQTKLIAEAFAAKLTAGDAADVAYIAGMQKGIDIISAALSATEDK